MSRLYFLIAFLILASPKSFSQTNPCQSPEQRHFDFWVGDWEVFDTLGNKIGENKIQQIENGCSLQESWKGTSGSNGTSLNYFDPSDSSWNQLWLDNSGGILKLKGKIEKPGLLRMSSEPSNGQINQITWTQQENDDVTQQWDILKEDGTLIQTIFLGIYKKQ